MKKTIALLMGIFLLCSTVSAQDMQKRGTQAGDKSLNFAFGGIGTFGIGSPNAYGGVSFSYFLSGSSAIRVGLNVGTMSETTPAADTNFTDAEESTFDLGIGADYIMYMTGSSSRVRPYFGGGVSVNLGSSNLKPSVATPTPAPGTVLERTNQQRATDGLTFGVAGLIGAEFYLYPELSLSAEYTLGLFSTTALSDQVTKRQGVVDATTKRATTTMLFGFNKAIVMLHLYL